MTEPIQQSWARDCVDLSISINADVKHHPFLHRIFSSAVFKTDMLISLAEEGLRFQHGCAGVFPLTASAFLATLQPGLEVIATRRFRLRVSMIDYPYLYEFICSSKAYGVRAAELRALMELGLSVRIGLAGQAQEEQSNAYVMRRDSAPAARLASTSGPVLPVPTKATVPFISFHTLLPAAAIDLGFHTTKYTFSKLAQAQAGDSPCGQFPSIAPSLSAAQKSNPAFHLDGVVVAVDNTNYFVGPHAQRMVGASGLHRADSSDYSTTPEYHALLLGTLWHIARDAHKGDGSLRIEHLTLGLPMATVRTHRQQLIQLAQGEHTLPAITKGGKPFKLYVGHVHVLSQPQGALLHCVDAVDGAVQEENVVVADLGGGTFDWYFSEAMVPNIARSGSYNRGMLNAATEACKIISPQSVHDVGFLGRIDAALRLGQAEVKITGRMVPMGEAVAAAHKVVDEALGQMAISIGSISTVDRVLVAGGGAPLLKARMAHVLPGLNRVAMMGKEPVYANVRGFLQYALDVALDD